MAGDHIHGAAAGDAELADGADNVRRARLRQLLDCQRHFGGGGERVATAWHGHRACVPSQAGDADLDAGAPGNRRDHAHRQAGVEQHRTLFDMAFDEAGNAAEVAFQCRPTISVAAETANCIAHRQPRIVGHLQPRRIEVAAHRGRPDHRDIEAHAFLIAKTDDLNRMRQAHGARVEIMDARDRAEDAK